MPVTVELPSDEATRLHALIDRLGLPGLIDVHTHFMPKSVLDKVWAYFDSVGPLTGREWGIAYRFDEAERVAKLRELGVVGWSSLNYPHKPGMAQWLNQWSADFAAAHPDCLQSATFYPELGAGDYVAEAIASGAEIFKAHVQVGAYDPTDDLLDGVWARLQESGVPVVLHAGSGPTPGEFTGPQRVRSVLERFPGLKLIIAHMGMPEYGEFLDLCDEFADVHLDTTMVFTQFVENDMPFPKDRLGDLVRLGDRVLLGTDFPNIPYPYVEALDAIVGLGLGDDWCRGVLHDNAARLFGRG